MSSLSPFSKLKKRKGKTKSEAGARLSIPPGRPPPQPPANHYKKIKNPTRIPHPTGSQKFVPTDDPDDPSTMFVVALSLVDEALRQDRQGMIHEAYGQYELAIDALVKIAPACDASRAEYVQGQIEDLISRQDRLKEIIKDEGDVVRANEGEDATDLGTIDEGDGEENDVAIDTSIDVPRIVVSREENDGKDATDDSDSGDENADVQQPEPEAGPSNSANSNRNTNRWSLNMFTKHKDDARTTPNENERSDEEVDTVTGDSATDDKERRPSPPRFRRESQTLGRPLSLPQRSSMSEDETGGPVRVTTGHLSMMSSADKSVKGDSQDISFEFERKKVDRKRHQFRMSTGAANRSSTASTNGLLSARGSSKINSKRFTGVLLKPTRASRRHSKDVHRMYSQEDHSSLNTMSNGRERLAMLLLGEDMSGGSFGKSSATTLSNAIVNLSVGVYGEMRRLEPVKSSHLQRWKDEMEWLLAPAEHIVVREPAKKELDDGSVVEVMVSVQRQDLRENLPVLREIDDTLVDVLDQFAECEFTYEKQQQTNESLELKRSSSTFSVSSSTENEYDKWWIDEPVIPAKGLSNNQYGILLWALQGSGEALEKARAINQFSIESMLLPPQYLAELPKAAKKILDPELYRAITSDSFDIEDILDHLKTKTGGNKKSYWDILNKLSDATVLWSEQDHSRRPRSMSFGAILGKQAHQPSVKIERAKAIISTLRRWYPDVGVTTSELRKLQENKDIALSILEAYSRVLESRAFTILARVESVIAAISKHGLVEKSDR
eukprot:GFYU01004742.1.p1 GENE.GFYU01004742.1~~GFYU01004742.1.p1  ORF type:complete len:780 (-),score=128.13 GFYU01004742.1:76-2415(-)